MAFPQTKKLGELEVLFRLMGPEDRQAILAFARSLPAHDLLVLRSDITQEEAVDAWLRSIASGRAITLLAESNGELIGYGTLQHSENLWTRHLGEILLLVDSARRGQGVGGQLARFLIDLATDTGLQKLFVQMMSNFRAAQSLFHHLGFIPEATLHDWVIDGNGRTHSLLIMSREAEGEEEIP